MPYLNPSCYIVHVVKSVQNWTAWQSCVISVIVGSFFLVDSHNYNYIFIMYNYYITVWRFICKFIACYHVVSMCCISNITSLYMTSQIPGILRHYNWSNSITHDVQTINHFRMLMQLSYWNIILVYSGISFAHRLTNSVIIIIMIIISNDCYTQTSVYEVLWTSW